MGNLTFAAFSAANRQRCEQDFGRKLGTRDSIFSMLIGLSEEAGEVAGEVRALVGFSERKTPSLEKLGKEIADLVSYADLLAQANGLDLATVLVAKFNLVSERVGSSVRLESGALCTTCVDVVVPPHVRGPACDLVYRNAEGALCGLCDGMHEHEHRGRQS